MTDHGKWKFALGLGAVVFGAIFAVSAEEQPVSSGEYICAGDNIKEGLVIESVIKDPELESTCVGGEVFKLRESAAATTMYMCPGSPLPVGWIISSVVPSHVVGANCPGGSSYQIKNSSGQSLMYMCPGSPLPSGWIISSSVPSGNVGANCPGGSSYQIRNSAPPPPPPPPAIPKAAVILPITPVGNNGHLVMWEPASDYPQYRIRFVLERSINGGGWHRVYKGWDNTSWTATGASPATYSYRVKRITPVADGQYSGVVSFTQGGL